MPEMTNERLMEVRYVSVADFSRRIDQIKDFNDKTAFAARYLLTHGLANDHDYSFAASVHFARMKLADALIESKGDASMKTENKDTFDYDFFMANPSGYLKQEAVLLAQDIAAKQSMDPKDIALKRHCELLASRLDEDLNQDIAELEEDMTVMDVKTRLENELGSRRALSEAYNATKSSLLRRAFSIPDEASKSLQSSYEGFQDPKNAKYGDLGALGNAAKGYLQDHFPGSNDGLNEEELSSLSGVEKAKAAFATSLVKAVSAQERFEADFKEIEHRSVENYKLAMDELSGSSNEEELLNEGFTRGENLDVEKQAQAIDQDAFQRGLIEDLMKDDDFAFYGDENESGLMDDLEKAENEADIQNSHN